jgi:oxygen-dependent protoporphyrinogen oxidase
VVVGGGIAGLVVAYDCSRTGLRVAVIEARERLGGLVARAEVSGVQVETGAESFAVRGGHVRALAEELGLGHLIVSPARDGAFITVPSRRAARTVRLPRRMVLGIPARPWARDVRRVIGWRGALRATMDRVLPSRVGAHAVSVADVVRARMGRRTLDCLVAPLCLSVHSTTPEFLALDAAVPGLRDAWRRTGSLGRGAATLATGSRAGSAVESLAGGVSLLVDALADAICKRGGEVLTGHAASRISSRPEGGFGVALAGRDPSESVRAESVVLATPRREAVRLLATVSGPLPEASRGRDIDVVTLALATERLDTHPRGTGVIVAPGTPGVHAKALTHMTAKWRWLADECGPSRHLVRLSYDPVRLGGLDDAAVASRVLADASSILGVALKPGEVLDFLRTSWPEGVSALDPADADAVNEASLAAEGRAGVHIAGAWIAGTGLASVVSHARQVAAAIIEERVRRDPEFRGRMSG